MGSRPSDMPISKRAGTVHLPDEDEETLCFHSWARPCAGLPGTRSQPSFCLQAAQTRDLTGGGGWTGKTTQKLGREEPEKAKEGSAEGGEERPGSGSRGRKAGCGEKLPLSAGQRGGQEGQRRQMGEAHV